MKTEDAIKGSELYLKNHGFDLGELSQCSSADEIDAIISSTVSKKDVPLFQAIINKSFVPNEDGSFNPFYETNPRTAGDSAEWFDFFRSYGNGKELKKEVRFDLSNHKGKKMNFLGYDEEITNNFRASDLVDQDTNSNTHIENKVGVWGVNLRPRIRQEFYADAIRLENDPTSKQEYRIYVNATNGKCLLDDSEQASYLKAMLERYPNSCKAKFEDIELLPNDIANIIANKERGVLAKDVCRRVLAKESPCVSSESSTLTEQASSLSINGQSYSLNQTAISKNIDENIRAVNGCNEISTNEISRFANSHGKTSNLVSVYKSEPAATSKFLIGFSDGMLQGAKYGAIQSGIDTIHDIMNGKEIDQNAIINAIKQTTYAAIKSGVIVGASNLAKNITIKKIAGTCGAVLVDCSSALMDFCKGRIGADELLNTALKTTVATGMGYAKNKMIRSVISGISSLGSASAKGAIIGGTAKVGGAVCGILKGLGGAFLACTILSLIFASGDKGSQILLPGDSRVTTLVEVDENGYCMIKQSMKDNLIEKLILYNDKLCLINKKSAEISQCNQALSQNAKLQMEQILREWNNDAQQLEGQILRQIERSALHGSDHYHQLLRSSVETYVERNMTAIKKQNIRLNELKEMEQNLLDEQTCCKHISECCQKIIQFGQSGTIQHEQIKRLISHITEDISNTPLSYRSNYYTTGADILIGCLAGA